MRFFAALAVVAFALPFAAAAPAKTPLDPVWYDQWAHRLVGAPEVWDVTTGDPSVLIATVDTGVNASIPDLQGAIVPGWDLVDGDADPQDTHGHGTHVASVLAARGDNGIAMAGYCWQCRILPIRVSANGSASSERIAAGISMAVDRGARIINVSFTHPYPDPVEHEAVRYALSRGALVVASAGNGSNDKLQYPAAYPEVLSVAATNDSDQLYFWSTRGSWVRLSAPGCHMVIDSQVGPGTLCGTSFAPAAVSGIAALLLSKRPGLTVYQLADALLANAKTPIDGIGGGRVDGAAAFASLGLLTRPAPPPLGSPPATGNGANGDPGIQRIGRRTYARQVEIQSDAMRVRKRITLRLGKGRLEAQLVTPRIRECSMSLKTPAGVVFALPSLDRVLGFSTEVAAGRYTLNIACKPTKQPRPYTLGIAGMLPVV